MSLRRAVVAAVESPSLLRDATGSGNWRVLASLLGTAYRGFVQGRGREAAASPMALGHDATFDWRYRRDFPELARLYEAAKGAQWNAATDLDWSRDVDPVSPERRLLPESFLPFSGLPAYQRLAPGEKLAHAHALPGCWPSRTARRRRS